MPAKTRSKAPAGEKSNYASAGSSSELSSEIAPRPLEEGESSSSSFATAPPPGRESEAGSNPRKRSVLCNSTSRKRIAIQRQGIPLSTSMVLPSLAEYKAQKEAEEDADIANCMAEAAATLRGVRESRPRILSRNTVSHYLRYERHWVEWCRRRQYHDISVVPERALRYMQENTAEYPDPEKGIEPLFVRSDGRGKSRKGPINARPSIQTVDMYIKALVNLYLQQCADPAYPNMTLQSQPNPRKYLGSVKDTYTNRLNREKASENSGRAAPVKGMTTDDFKQIMRASWTRSFQIFGNGKKGQRKRNSLRDRLDLSWLHFMMCRGESTRKARLPNLFTYKVSNPDDGRGQFALAIMMRMLQSRKMKSGRYNYGVIVRNKDVQICPVGSLAFYMLEYWSEKNVSALQDDYWTSFRLIPGNDMTTEISNSSQYLAHRSLMDQAGVKAGNKVAYNGRILRLQFAQTCGASVEAVAQHGNWALYGGSTHSLFRIEAGVALQMAGFRPPQERLWLSRNTIIPPIELQRLVFPFIEEQFPGDPDWSAWIENIMLDRDVFFGRPRIRPITTAALPGYNSDRPSADKDAQDDHGDTADDFDDEVDGDDVDDEGGDDEDNSEDNNHDSGGEDNDNRDYTVAKRRHLILLAHLRKVVLQDAVALIALGETDSECRYQNHHVFKHPAFSSQLFYDFKAQLCKQMRSATLPVADSLMVNPTDITHRLRTVESRVLDLTRLIQTEIGREKAMQEETSHSIQVHMSNTARTANSNLLELRKDIQDLRNENRSRDQTLCKMMNRVATQLHLIVQEEAASSRIPTLVPEQQSPVREPSFDSTADDDAYHQLEMHSASSSDSDNTQQAQLPRAEQDVLSRDASLSPTQEQTQTLTQPLLRSSVQPSAESIDTLMDRIMAAAAAATTTSLSKPAEMPACAMISRDASLDDVWKEWFYGVDGKPSICQLNQWYRTTWRRGSSRTQSNANAVLYLFKKNIIHAVLNAFPLGSEKTLAEREASALTTIKERIQAAGSLSLFEKSLPKNASRRRLKGTGRQQSD